MTLWAQKCIDPGSVDVGIAIEELKRYKSLGTEQILAELIQAGRNTLHSEINKLNSSIWNKEELLQQWKESVNCSKG
jgi:hypothetical protein